MIPGMGEIFHISHNSIKEIFEDPVEITEKVDGSFISFRLTSDGDLQMRSKGQELHWDSPSSKMFRAGIESIWERQELLNPDWIYRGEYMMKPKHNSLAYDRIPKGHIILFDIEISLGSHLEAPTRNDEAQRIGLEAVPVLFESLWIRPISELQNFLAETSVLGGQKIEGVVVKNYHRTLHGHMLMGKLVSEAFKEVHNKEWKTGNPGKGDVVQQLIDKYTTPARWNKAIIHLQERGELQNAPQDIGPLMKEIAADVKKEEEENIKQALFDWAWPQIARSAASGFPEWYKAKLLEG